VRPDIRLGLWEKFIFICGVSGVTALTRLPMGLIFADRETAALMRATLEEAAAVARAEGVNVAPQFAEQAAASMAKMEPWFRGSMAQDLLEGRRLARHERGRPSRMLPDPVENSVSLAQVLSALPDPEVHRRSLDRYQEAIDG